MTDLGSIFVNGAREKEAWARHTLAKVSRSLEEAEKALALAESVGNDSLIVLFAACTVLLLDRAARQETMAQHALLGATLGLDRDWAVRIVEQVGNYAESY